MFKFLKDKEKQKEFAQVTFNVCCVIAFFVFIGTIHISFY